MSILIKGIDMPEVNETRMIAITQSGVAFFTTVKDGEASKSEKAEAIQIPYDVEDMVDDVVENHERYKKGGWII